MATKIELPIYKYDKSYEQYKKELSAWRLVTDLKPEKQGIVVALSLPEEDGLKIREKVFEEIKLADLNVEGGLDTLIDFLDKQLGKDELENALERFEDFEDYSRHSDESISQYIANFDQKYSRIRSQNINLPSEILAFKLLRRAGISREEKLLVLTGMDYSQKVNLFEQAKKSLKKFVGEGGAGGGSSLGTLPAIKIEPAFITNSGSSGRGIRGGDKGQRGLSGWRGFRGRGRGDASTYVKGERHDRPMNPLGRDGQVMTCKCCGSFRHFLRDCPDSWENSRRGNIGIGNQSEEHAILFTGCSREDFAVLISEAYNCAVLDSACSSTVCGTAWLETYLDTLPEAERRTVRRQDSNKVFKFGGGTKLSSMGEYILPALLVGNKVQIRTDVVESDIPLLLSRRAMKVAKVKLDIENDAAVIMGKPVSLNLTSCGHYSVPLGGDICVEQVHAMRLDSLSGEKRRNALLKLHRQFAHPSRGKLEALLRNAGVWLGEFSEDLDVIYKECLLCKQYATTAPRPVVGMPVASLFNEVVSMDLKLWPSGAKTRWILHMIDMYSRYTQSVFIERKRTTDVIDAVMGSWIGVFGVMKSILTDNGGEFTGEEVRDVASVLNIRLCTTAAESPFQNGLCERVHAVTDRMLVKLQAQFPKTPVDILLKWANMARNSLQMWNGFSSHQLVFGQNPNLPCIMTDQIPALDGRTASEIFEKHLNALHAARQSYTQLEADERIRRALRNKVRASEQTFEMGDLVFYKRDGNDRWLGPGKVVCQDSKIIFVRHGSSLIRVSANRLIKAGTAIGGEDGGGHLMESEVRHDDVRKMPENADPVVEYFGLEDGEEIGGGQQGNMVGDGNTVSDVVQNFEGGDSLNRGTDGNSTGTDNSPGDQDNNGGEPVILRRSLRKFNREEGYKVYASCLSREEQCNLDCLTAKEEELGKLKSFDTYEEVRDHGQKCISTRWVLTLKDGKPKARLVARGFEEDSSDIVSDSPTVAKTTVRLFLTVVASLGWQVKTTDIKSAFLQGKILDRTVYIKPPRDADVDEGVVWRLKRCLYGLSDASRQFYLSVREKMLEVGCFQSKVEPTLFYYLGKEGKLDGILVSHIDDFLHAGSDVFEQKVMVPLRERFEVGKLEEKSFSYVGFQIYQDENGIILDQNDYVQEMDKKLRMEEGERDRESVLDRGEMTLYRAHIGAINWVVQCTRPDMAYELIELSMKSKQATMDELRRTRKVISRLQDLGSHVFFPTLGAVECWSLYVYTDASHANLPDGVSSAMGCLVFVVGRGGVCCPVSWRANKIKRVVRSTLAAETMALQEGLEEGMYIQSLIKELHRIEVPITAYVDNKSLVEAVHSTKQVNDRRLRIDIGAIKEILGREVQEIKWTHGSAQLANCLTKKGASGRDLLGVIQAGKFTF